MIEAESALRSGRKRYSGFDEFGAQGLRIVGPCNWHTHERKMVGGEEFVDEVVALHAIGAVVRAVVEFDGAEDAAGARVRENEVDVFATDFIECRLLAALLTDIEEIGKANFARDHTGRADDWVEHGKKSLLGGSH